jgi:intein/homing endonuclease
VDISNLNKPEVLYILGFIWADGNLYKDSINISIKQTDFDNISSIFNQVGNWGYHTRERQSKQTDKTYITTKISINDKKLANFLLKNDFNIKSHTSPNKILSIIPNELKNHFYRGYIDGDGSFSLYSNNQICNFNITS